MSLLKKKAKLHENANTQISVPEDIASEILEIGKQFIPDEFLSGDGRELESHITLKYGVEEDEDKLQQVLSAFAPFTVTLGKTIVFPPSESSEGDAVVVVEVHGHGLAPLHEAIMEAMGTQEDNFSYTPHLTIAYVKAEEADQFAGSDVFAGFSFTATEVTLSKRDSDQVSVPLNKTASVLDEFKNLIETVKSTGQKTGLINGNLMYYVTSSPDWVTSDARFPVGKIGDYVVSTPDGKHKIFDSAASPARPAAINYAWNHPYKIGMDKLGSKNAAAPGVTPEIPEVESEVVERDEPATDEFVDEEAEAVLKEQKRNETWRKRQKQPAKPKPERSQYPLPDESDVRNDAPRKVTKSKTFKAWFGKSKVVDNSGKPLMVYHGTTHNVTEFDPNGGNADNHYGQAIYFTDSKLDVAANYATDVGPDITNRIEHRYEEIESQLYDMSEEDIVEQFGEEAADADRLQEIIKERAKEEIVGQHGGATMPVYLSIQNPVYVQRRGGTQFEVIFDEETGDESGTGVELYQALMSVAGTWGIDGQEIWNKVAEDMQFDAYDFEQAVRKNDRVEDGEGNQAQGQFIADVYQELGCDGIIMSAWEEFGARKQYGQPMKMDYDAKHYIIWDATKVKSAIGNASFDSKSPNITAAKQGSENTQWLYHVTFSGYLDSIETHGLTGTGGGGITGGGSGLGSVFMSEADHVSYWLHKAEQWAYHRADNPIEEGWVPIILRFPRADAEQHGFGPDEVAVKEDTGEGSYEADFVPPDNLQAWNGTVWVALNQIDPHAFVDDEGYILDQKPKLAAKSSNFFATGSVLVASEKSVGDLGLAKRIMHELMPVLGEQLPEPELKIVNQPRAGWLGRDTWRIWIKNGQIGYGDNTTIDVQRSILNDETTLRRVLAHELCHHADSLIDGVKELGQYINYGMIGYKMFLRGQKGTGHGTTWRARAQKFNAQFGADFVTEKSDESYTQEELPLKPYYVRMLKQQNGKIYYAVATRIGKAIDWYLGRKKQNPSPDERMTKTDSRLLMHAVTIGNGWSVPGGKNKEEKEKLLQQLWDATPPEEKIEPPAVSEADQRRQEYWNLVNNSNKTGARVRHPEGQGDWEYPVNHGKLPEAREATNITSVIKQRVEAFIDAGAKSAWGINNGECQEFAYDIAERVKGAEIFETGFSVWEDAPEPVHFFIRYNNRWYDAEAPRGVENWKDLPIFQSSEPESDEPTKIAGAKTADYESYLDTRDSAAVSIIEEYKANYKNLTHRMKWEVVPAARLKKIWNDYTKTGFVRDEKGMGDIAWLVLWNICKLEVNTVLCGHTSDDSVAFANDTMGENFSEDFFDIDNQFFEDEKGSWRISDYALDPLIKDAVRLLQATTAEQKLQVVDHILNIVHARSDLASWFVQGGTGTLTSLAGKTAQANSTVAGESNKTAGEVTYLYHGTTASNYERIMLNDSVITEPSYWGTERIATFYAKDAVEAALEYEADEAEAIIRIPLSHFNTNKLRSDENSVAEPLTYTLQRSEEDLYADWQNSEGKWQDSLRIYESVVYDATIKIIPEMRVASNKTAGRKDAGTSMTVGVNGEKYPEFPQPVLIRWEQGMRWRSVLKVVKSIVGDVAGSRVQWRDIFIWGSFWEDFETQQAGWEEQKLKGSRVMFDILHNGTFVSVGAAYKQNEAVGLGVSDKEGSYEPPINSFGAYDRFVEWLPTSLVTQFREFDREMTPTYEDSAELDRLEEDIKQNGIKEPLLLEYVPNEHVALLTEGNHRLAVAARLGMPKVPVRVYRRGKSYGNNWKPVPGYKSEGHIPADMKPSDIGLKNASHKTPPASDTGYRNPERGEETNAYADIPERVEGQYDVPGLSTLAPQFFKESSGPLKGELTSLKAKFAQAAQQVYDEWEQNAEGIDAMLGVGGICAEIANAIAEVIARNILYARVDEGGQDGDDHSWLLVWDEDDASEAYGVDIPHQLYEVGGGYNWKKKLSVIFNASDVQVFPVEINPADLAKESSVKYKNALLQKKAEYAEGQAMTQHSDHTPVGMSKTLKSDPFSEEMALLHGELEPNPALPTGKMEGVVPRAEGEDDLEVNQGESMKKAAITDPWQQTEDEFAGKWDEQETEEQNQARYTKKRQWQQAALRALSLGQISPQEAKQRGTLLATDPEKFKPLPPDLYHVTTAKSKVMSEGLKTRQELNQEYGAGLGGGTSQAISFTADPEIARGIYENLLIARKVAAGEMQLEDLIAIAKAGTGASKPWLNDIVNSLGRGEVGEKELDALKRGMTWTQTMGNSPMEGSVAENNYRPKPGDWRPTPWSHHWTGGDGVERYTNWERAMDANEKREAIFEFFKKWSFWREQAGGGLDPLYFMSDPRALGQTPESEIAILHFKPVPGAQGTQESGLGEWRTYTGAAVQLVGEGVNKTSSDDSDNWRYQSVVVDGELVSLRKLKGGKLYHGTGAVLHPGDIISPGKANFAESDSNKVSLTSDIDRAAYWPRQAGVKDIHVYEVEPIGQIVSWRVGWQDSRTTIVLWEARAPKARVIQEIKNWDNNKTAAISGTVDLIGEGLGKTSAEQTPPQNIEAWARGYQDQFGYGPPCGGPATDYVWHQDDNFPVASLNGSPEEWKEWFDQEKFWAAEGGRPDQYFEKMEKWWTTNPDEHIFVVQGTDGEYYVWEGTHRQAISKIHNKQTIPAFVGTPKPTMR